MYLECMDGCTDCTLTKKKKDRSKKGGEGGKKRFVKWISHAFPLSASSFSLLYFSEKDIEKRETETLADITLVGSQ